MPPPNPDQAPFIDSLPGVIQPGGNVLRRRLAQALVMVALVVPWVMPFAGNPSPGVWPWLSAAFGAGLLLLVAAVRPMALTADMVRGGWIAAAAISAAMGAVQYFGFSEHFTPWLNQTRPGEAFGNLRQRNQFASLMGIGLVALIWRRGPGAGKSLPLLLILLALGNAASSSRTGALQWLAILAVALVYPGPGRAGGAGRTALFAFGVYLVWVLVLPWLLVLLTGAHAGGLVARFEETPGCSSRLVLWSNVLTLIAEKPWLGWGWGELDYAHYMTLYPGERFCDILDNAHNLPLHLAVELGVPFAATVCAVLTWRVWRARPWRETDPSRQMAWAVLAVIGLHSLLEYPLWYGPFQMAAGLCVYLLWTTRVGPSPRDHTSGLVRPGLAAAGTVILAAVVYAAWDYHRVSQIYLGAAQRDPAYRDNTLEKISATRLFRRQADFAALSLTPLTPANALQLHVQSSELLHFSPEPRVIEKVIESAVMLRRDDEALLHLARYRAAFPLNHAQWRAALGIAGGPAD